MPNIIEEYQTTESHRLMVLSTIKTQSVQITTCLILLLSFSYGCTKAVMKIEEKRSLMAVQEQTITVKLELSEAPKMIWENGKCYRLVLGSMVTDKDLKKLTDQDIIGNDVVLKLPCYKVNIPMVIK